MERGQISDKQVTASSFIQGHHPHQGRLNNVFKQVNGSALWGSWCAQNVDTTQYIQVTKFGLWERDREKGLSAVKGIKRLEDKREMWVLPVVDQAYSANA